MKMVQLFRQGNSIRSIALRFHKDKKTVKKWIDRAGDHRLDRVDFSDKRSQRKATHNRIHSDVENCIIHTRHELKTKSSLGEYGARAIQRYMKDLGCYQLPSERTINNVLRRNGLLDGNQRMRFPSPPPGWYLPEVYSLSAEMDCFDYIEDLRLQGDLGYVFVMNVISLHGSLVNSWVAPRMGSGFTVLNMLEHWKRYGRPRYAQFDNGPVFNGPPKPDQIGQVIRLCLELGTTAVFTIPRCTGPQAKIERFNLQWQTSLWNRFNFENWHQLRKQANLFLEAYRMKNADRISQAPERIPVPTDWQPSFPTDVHGKVIYLRQTNEKGQVSVLGHSFDIDPDWTIRMVRCEVDLTQNQIMFYRLRRREPSDQPLIKTIDYEFPRRKFTPLIQ